MRGFQKGMILRRIHFRLLGSYKNKGCFLLLITDNNNNQTMQKPHFQPNLTNKTTSVAWRIENGKLKVEN